jgi:hypothetical protein
MWAWLVILSMAVTNEISPVLSVRDFLETCKQSVRPESLQCLRPAKTEFSALAQEMGVSEETVAQVSAICHEDQLLCPAVPDLEDWDVLTNGIPDGVNLATLK